MLKPDKKIAFNKRKLLFLFFLSVFLSPLSQAATYPLSATELSRAPESYISTGNSFPGSFGVLLPADVEIEEDSENRKGSGPAGSAAFHWLENSVGVKIKKLELSELFYGLNSVPLFLLYQALKVFPLT